MGNKKKGKILAVLLSGALLSTQIPTGAAAEGAAGYTGGICGHHPIHTAECGYQEAVPEQPCRHEHTKGCYEYVTSCVHEHTQDCYPLTAVEMNAETREGTDESAQPQTELVRGAEPSGCVHVCSEESGCVTRTLNCIHEDKENADGSVTPAVHDTSCGYATAVEGKECTFVCEICSVQSLSETETEVPTVQTGTEAARTGPENETPAEKTPEGTEPDTEAAANDTTKKAPGANQETGADEAVSRVQALIDALPSAEEVEKMTKDEQKEIYDKEQDAADAYFDELTEEQQKQLDPTKLMDLMNYFNSQVSMMADVVATVEVNGKTTEYDSLGNALEAAGASGTIGIINGNAAGSVIYNPSDETVSAQASAGKITVKPLSNTTTFGSAQYSLDGTNWQDTNVLNCKADTSYTVYARYSKAPSKTWNTTVKSEDASYTVSIPSAPLTVGDSKSKAEISVDTSKSFDLGYGGQIEVKVKGGGAVSTGGVLTLTRQGASDTLTSAMLVNGAAFTDIDAPVATFAMDNYMTEKAEVSFGKPQSADTTQTVIPAGTYSGTVTFDITYREQQGGTA